MNIQIFGTKKCNDTKKAENNQHLVISRISGKDGTCGNDTNRITYVKERFYPVYLSDKTARQ